MRHRRSLRCPMLYSTHPTNLLPLPGHMPSWTIQNWEQETAGGIGEGSQWYITFLCLSKWSACKGPHVKDYNMGGSNWDVYQNCNSVRNMNEQISDEQWFLRRQESKDHSCSSSSGTERQPSYSRQRPLVPCKLTALATTLLAQL